MASSVHRQSILFRNILNQLQLWCINSNNFKDFEVNNLVKLIENLSTDKKEYFLLKESMKNFSYQNTWNNVNQKLIGLINEN